MSHTSGSSQSQLARTESMSVPMSVFPLSLVPHVKKAGLE